MNYFSDKNHTDSTIINICLLSNTSTYKNIAPTFIFQKGTF